MKRPRPFARWSILVYDGMGRYLMTEYFFLKRDAIRYRLNRQLHWAMSPPIRRRRRGR